MRFTQTNVALYATLLGSPKSHEVTLKGVSAKAGAKIQLLGDKTPLAWSRKGDDLRVTVPAEMPGHYAFVLKIAKAVP